MIFGQPLGSISSLEASLARWQTTVTRIRNERAAVPCGRLRFSGPKRKRCKTLKDELNSAKGQRSSAESALKTMRRKISKGKLPEPGVALVVDDTPAPGFTPSPARVPSTLLIGGAGLLLIGLLALRRRQ